MCSWYWRAAALVGGCGIAIAVLSFDDGGQWFLVGLTMAIVSVVVANTGYIAARSRSLDEEFEVGYRVGYRAGRRAPRLEPVTPIRRQSNGLLGFNEAVRSGRVPQAPIRVVAGHDSAP